MNHVKAYNNGNRTLLYSVETYKRGAHGYFAVTSDSMKRVVMTKYGELVSKARPLSEGDTRLEAIENLQRGIKVMCGVEPENQSFIAVRHHDTWACFLCLSLPRFDTYEGYRHHTNEVHPPVSVDTSRLVLADGC